MLWVLLVVFLGWTGFTVYEIARSCVDLYQLDSALPLVPSMILGLISLLFAGGALYWVFTIALWKIEAMIHRLNAVCRQAELLKRQMSLEDRL